MKLNTKPTKDHHMRFVFSASLCVILFAFPSLTRAQDDSTGHVALRISMVNKKGDPVKGEEVLFVHKSNNAIYANRTNQRGECIISVPEGANYAVEIKSMNDTVFYDDIRIPFQQENGYRLKTLSIEITFEPARSFIIDNIYFPTNQHAIKAASYKALDEIAAYMLYKDNQVYEIAGHTDNEGSNKQNLRLSQQRAEAIRRYLIKKGVASERLIAKGYGSSRPLAENTSASGRQMNRRTEIHLQ